MSNGWKGDNGGRWQRADRIAVARRFRAHVDTPHNREKGRSCRIQRRDCFWHPGTAGEAHHLDYARPFLVVWVGLFCGCHRKVEHGTLSIPRKAVFDYTSLIEGPYGIARPGACRQDPAPRKSKAQGCICGIRAGDQPHADECPQSRPSTSTNPF